MKKRIIGFFLFFLAPQYILATVINTNVGAVMMAQSSLSRQSEPMLAAMEMLSTGTQVNSPTDDAAYAGLGSRGEQIYQNDQQYQSDVFKAIEAMKNLSRAANQASNYGDYASLNNELDAIKNDINRINQLNEGWEWSVGFKLARSGGDISYKDPDYVRNTIDTEKTDFGATLTANLDDENSISAIVSTGSLQKTVDFNYDLGNQRVKSTDTDFQLELDHKLFNNALSPYFGAGFGVQWNESQVGPVTTRSSNAFVYGSVGISYNNGKWSLNLGVRSAPPRGVVNLPDGFSCGSNDLDLEYEASLNVNLTSIARAASSSSGRILDADYAQETSNLAKAQILQQAATAMFAQANASKHDVLKLLR